MSEHFVVTEAVPLSTSVTPVQAPPVRRAPADVCVEVGAGVGLAVVNGQLQFGPYGVTIFADDDAD